MFLFSRSTTTVSMNILEYYGAVQKQYLIWKEISSSSISTLCGTSQKGKMTKSEKLLTYSSSCCYYCLPSFKDYLKNFSNFLSSFCVILWQVKHSYIYDHHSKIMPERGVKERERTEDRAVGRYENSGGKYVVMCWA